MLRENIGPKEELETDKFTRALLAYRNTPSKDLGESPAQILYGRTLRDHLPVLKEHLQQRKEWIMLKAEREKALATKYGRIKDDLDRHSKPLTPLVVGTVVQVQNQRGKDPLRWDRSGTVVESLGNQQYSVKMDGSGRVSLRNRRFLRVIEPFLPRYISVDSGPITHQAVGREGGEDQVVDDASEKSIEDQVVDETVKDNEVRRSIRNRHSPDRYDA